MASPGRRLTFNVDGDFYVDDSCIDCGTCRWMAPATFDAKAGYARVYRQPAAAPDVARALEALVSCPTASIGTRGAHPVRAAAASFPRRVEADVYHCGYHSEHSFGAASWLIVRDGGNVLIDSPRFTRRLVRRIEELGGVRYLFLTHRDDVADHARFAAHFGCERILHADDVASDTRGVERQLTGDAEIELADDLVVIPTPGHTRGSCCLVYRDRFLFSGDHVAYSRSLGHVYAFAGACWYDWDAQIRSMKRLAGYRFEHILPGHSAPCQFPADQMAAQLRTCIDWMQARR